MADNTPSNNVAGELNVKFTADATPVKQAAAEAKVALEGVAGAGKSAGAEIASGAEAAAAGLEGAAAGAAGLAAALPGIGAALAVVIPLLGSIVEHFDEAHRLAIGLNNELVKQADDARARLNIIREEIDGHSALEKAKQRDRERESDDIRKANELLKETKDHAAATNSQVEARIRAIKEEHSAIRAALDEEASKRQQITAARLRDAAAIKEAELGGDGDATATAKAQAEINRLEEEKKKLGADATAGAEAIRKAIDDRIQQIGRELEAIKERNLEERNFKDMREESEAAIARAKQEERDRAKQEREEQRQREREQRDHEREMAKAARERLQIEREITQQKRQQQSGFGLGNVPFSGSRAMESALNQGDISRIWSD